MLRFTIRDVLWLTLLVAACLTWYLAHRHTVGELDKLKRAIVVLKTESANGRASIDFWRYQFKKATALNGLQSTRSGTDDMTANGKQTVPLPD